MSDQAIKISFLNIEMDSMINRPKESEPNVLNTFCAMRV